MTLSGFSLLVTFVGLPISYIVFLSLTHNIRPNSKITQLVIDVIFFVLVVLLPCVIASKGIMYGVIGLIIIPIVLTIITYSILKTISVMALSNKGMTDN